MENILGPSESSYHLQVDYYGEEQCSSGHYHGPAVRDNYLIHYILHGSGIFKTKDKTYHLQGHEGFLICPNEVTYYQADDDDPWHYAWIGFHGDDIKFILNQTGLSSHNPIFHYYQDDKLTDYFNQINQLNLLGQGKEVFLTGLAYMIIGSLIRHNVSKDASLHRESIPKIYLYEALRYIHNHYYKDLTIRDLAKYLGIDRSYVYKIFMQQLKQSPKTYMMHYRFKKACFLLQTTHLSIHAIACSVGYKDALTFSKAFKKMYHLSPTYYRLKHAVHHEKGHDIHV
ncbi:AraC family transcriptional regulator [Vallitalea pronyensis]|uniref:AraC family transcriptional regulator n=1 Tax=Vallitalea pronyensis TaxID=1348613 RepID=A0A8J8SI60_9FIRM|nr:AraC family transcriptional regulator [Vallitalea pronyensis]QUI24580.1 AraC family transcriptional regulator [Vallitalea pronyensis]